MKTLGIKYTDSVWKNRHRASQKSKKYLKKQLSRKAAQLDRYRQENILLKKRLQTAEKALLKLPPNAPNRFGQSGVAVPQGHKYGLWLVCMCIQLQTSANLSYRQVRKVIASFLAEKNWPLVIPSATSVRNWVRKLSYYRLCYDVYATEIDLGDKVLLLDLSGGIGREKALVILGVDVKAWHCAAHALTFSDICVLSVKTGTTWNSDTISAEIDSVKGKIGGNVPYIVTDRDSTVQSACRQSGLVNVSDCTHWQSNCLERYYKNDEAFKLLHAELGKIRQKWVNSKLSALIAPNMRTKSRFLNLYEIIDWLDKLTSHFDKLDPKIQETLGFIQHHKVLIEELILMINLIKKISKILKIKGLNAQTELDVKDLFGKISHKTTILTRFEQDMTHYMHQIRMMLPNQNNIMCCDVVT